jgi:hypothetical protein
VEGDGVTDPGFLDDPAGIIPGLPGSIRLDDPERLVREAAKESFSWWRPRSRPRLGGPSINDLVAHRWHLPIPTAAEEIELIRRIQSSDICGPFPRSHLWPDDFAKILASCHGLVLSTANGHMPRYWRPRRLALRDKHTNTLFYEDLVAAGIAMTWMAALKFDLAAGNRFWTAARLPVLGAVSDEARLWRRHGSGEGRLDRWLYTHKEASPEQVLAAQQRLVKRPVFHSLQEAAEGIKQFWSWGTDANIDFDEDMEAAACTLRSMYDCSDPHQLSYSYFDYDGMAAPADSRLSYLEIHKHFSLIVDRLSGGFAFGHDLGNVSRPKTPREPLDCSETTVVRFKNGEHRVARQRASPGHRIEVTPELQAKAKEDLEFAVRRWQSRTRRLPLPGEQYPRWSTKFGAGRAEHENKQIVPAYLTDGNPFKWVVRYRGAEGELLSVLESPSWHCLKPRPCEFCEEARSRSRSHNVALPSIPSRRAVGRRSAAVDRRPQNPPTKPRTAETRLEKEKCQTFADLLQMMRQHN